MFGEFVILLCAGSFVYGTTVHTTGHNASKQDHLASPSETSHRKLEPPSNKYLPTSAPSYYEVNSAVGDTLTEVTTAKSVPVHSYGPPNVKQQSFTLSTSVASDSASRVYNNILERYNSVAQPIKPYFAVPVAAKSVTIESHGEAKARGPVGQTVYGQNVSPFVVYTNNPVQLRPHYAVPLAAPNTGIESQEPVNIYPTSSYGIQHVAPAVAYNTNFAPRLLSAVPLSANGEIVQSHAAFPTHSPAVDSYYANQVQAVTVNPPVAQYNVDQGQAVTINPPVAQYNVDQVQTVTVSPPVGHHHVNQGQAVTINPPLAQYHVDQGQAVTANPPVAQYVSVPQITYGVNPAVRTVSVPTVPVGPNKVTIEAYNSVTAHPPPAPKYAVPVPVPVVYHAAAQHPAAQQYYVEAPVRGEPVPLQLNSGDPRLQYYSVPVYGVPQNGYARAVLFSPASEVSHVNFNGLGVISSYI